MKLYLVRHSETNYNLEKRANADPSVDVHLTDLGISQTENLSKQLKDIHFDVIYISQLPRTRQTADIINTYHGSDIVVDARINDNKTGFEGKKIDEWLAALDSSDDRWGASFNDGESLREAASRAADFIEELKQKDYTSVLVVTHGFMTQAIYGHLHDQDLEKASEYILPQGTFAEFDI